MPSAMNGTRRIASVSADFLSPAPVQIARNTPGNFDAHAFHSGEPEAPRSRA